MCDVEVMPCMISTMCLGACEVDPGIVYDYGFHVLGRIMFSGLYHDVICVENEVESLFIPCQRDDMFYALFLQGPWIFHVDI